MRTFAGFALAILIVWLGLILWLSTGEYIPQPKHPDKPKHNHAGGDYQELLNAIEYQRRVKLYNDNYYREHPTGNYYYQPIYINCYEHYQDFEYLRCRAH